MNLEARIAGRDNSTFKDAETDAGRAAAGCKTEGCFAPAPAPAPAPAATWSVEYKPLVRASEGPRAKTAGGSAGERGGKGAADKVGTRIGGGGNPTGRAAAAGKRTLGPRGGTGRAGR